MLLDGKVLIVSGAASGIGRGLAKAGAAQGASVVCADINDSSPTVEEITSAGGAAIAVRMDVREFDTWVATVDTAKETFGGVDLLGNIAGITNTLGPDTVTDVSEEHWHWVVDTCLTGTWLGMKAVIPAMRERGGGRIVNISSMVALRGMKNLAAYSAAKGGVGALTQQAAIEYAPDNILINAIAPGTINTPMLHANNSPEQLEAYIQVHGIKRLGEPSDIAAMALHFFGPESGSWLTGAVMPVDGGWHVT